jgi:hypothetical protein
MDEGDVIDDLKACSQSASANRSYSKGGHPIELCEGLSHYTILTDLAPYNGSI